MDDPALVEVMDDTVVLARVSTENKLRLDDIVEGHATWRRGVLRELQGRFWCKFPLGETSLQAVKILELAYSARISARSSSLVATRSK